MLRNFTYYYLSLNKKRILKKTSLNFTAFLINHTECTHKTSNDRWNMFSQFRWRLGLTLRLPGHDLHLVGQLGLRLRVVGVYLGPHNLPRPLYLLDEQFWSGMWCDSILFNIKCERQIPRFPLRKDIKLIQILKCFSVATKSCSENLTTGLEYWLHVSVVKSTHFTLRKSAWVR